MIPHNRVILNRLAAVRSKLWLGLRASSVSYWRFWAAVQQGDVDDWLGAIASKLDSGFHVGISLTAPVVPDPKTANEVRHRAILKWLAAIQNLRPLIRQPSCEAVGLLGRQKRGMRSGSAAPDKRKCEGS
jgi:hypothetical protein